jgi:hypothetical protein
MRRRPVGLAINDLYHITSESKHGNGASHETYRQGEGSTARDAATRMFLTGDYARVTLKYCRQIGEVETVLQLIDDEYGFRIYRHRARAG